MAHYFGANDYQIAIKSPATSKNEYTFHKSIRGDLRPPKDCEFSNCGNAMGRL